MLWKLLKTRRGAAIVLALSVAFGTLFGVNRSVDNEFDAAAKRKANAALNLVTVARKYDGVEFEELLNCREGLLQAISDWSPKAVRTQVKRLDSDFETLYAALFAEPELTKIDKRNINSDLEALHAANPIFKGFTGNVLAKICW